MFYFDCDLQVSSMQEQLLCIVRDCCSKCFDVRDNNDDNSIIIGFLSLPTLLCTVCSCEC